MKPCDQGARVVLVSQRRAVAACVVHPAVGGGLVDGHCGSLLGLCTVLSMAKKKGAVKTPRTFSQQSTPLKKSYEAIQVTTAHRSLLGSGAYFLLSSLCCLCLREPSPFSKSLAPSFSLTIPTRVSMATVWTPFSSAASRNVASEVPPEPAAGAALGAAWAAGGFGADFRGRLRSSVTTLHWHLRPQLSKPGRRSLQLPCKHRDAGCQ